VSPGTSGDMATRRTTPFLLAHRFGLVAAQPRSRSTSAKAMPKWANLPIAWAVDWMVSDGSVIIRGSTCLRSSLARSRPQPPSMSR
jgi:hypothetical protein